ncbi:MAG: hypothetical protein Q7T05_00480, partial [Dehalococcoidia bacterium]|nr:hypothetical protein [Dehalococcoidia bacterium]
VRFAFRTLENGERCVAAWGPDIDALPPQEKAVWRGYLLDNATYAQVDPAFQRWVDRYIEGSWEVEGGPRTKVEKQIRLIRALTNQTLGRPLMLFEGLHLVNYPVAENTDAYAKAHLELYRVVIDGLDPDAIHALADRLRVELSNRSKTLNSLKEVLPSDLVSRVHKPLKDCSDTRNKVHGVPSEPVRSFPAFATFQRDLEAIAEALTELGKWIERELGADSERCLRREQAMLHFPKFTGPPRPADKLAELKRAEGKTIESVDFGEEAVVPGSHQAEAIVIHFTDGSGMAIRVGSNAETLSARFEDLKPEDFSTDLIIIWAPPIK